MHITEYRNRHAARAAYLHHRETWDRRASLALIKLHLAKDWRVRLACGVMLANAGIPCDGVWHHPVNGRPAL